MAVSVYIARPYMGVSSNACIACSCFTRLYPLTLALCVTQTVSTHLSCSPTLPGNPRDHEVFQCMLKNLFADSECFPKYPEKELYTKVARAEAKQDAKNMAARADGAGAGSGWRSALQGALDDIGVVGGSPSPGKGAAKLHAVKAALKARRHPPTPRMYMSHHIIYVTPHYICHTQSRKFTPRALRALSQHSRPCYTPNPAPKR